MKNKYLILLIIVCLGILTMTSVLSNTWLLLTDSANYIPKNSNIFTFQPTQIDSGSGGYWQYGEDHSNYYYFSETESNTYFYISKKAQCDNLDPLNYLTWCTVDMKKIKNI